MSFTSVSFLLLLAVTLAVYFVLPKKWRWTALLAASVIFYAAAVVKLLAFLLFATLSTYFAGLWLGRLTDARKKAVAEVKANGGSASAVNSTYRKKKHAVAALALCLNFGILAVLKYLDPLLDDWNLLFPGHAVIAPKLLLPLGISFYTFQSAGYLIDLVREKYPACKNLGKYALFVSFFPQITQGPIGRYDKLAPQFDTLPGFSAEHLRSGIQLALWGVFKKLVIADRAAVIVNTVFSGQGYGGVIVFFAALVYGIQIYCDFSGGIDMARGVAQMFGVDLAENFRRPYLAASLADYWRRWHITLGEWMREYVFYSITFSPRFARFSKRIRGSLKGRAGKVLPTALATFVVFFLIGLWHGGSTKYLFFGVYNGVIITFSQLMEGPYTSLKKRLRIKPSAPWNLFAILRTLLLVTLGRYFTRADNLSSALELLTVTFAHPGLRSLTLDSFLSLGLAWGELAVLFGGFSVVVIAGVFEEKRGDFRTRFARAPAVIQVLLTLALLLCITFFGIYREGYLASQFIYQTF